MTAIIATENQLSSFLSDVLAGAEILEATAAEVAKTEQVEDKPKKAKKSEATSAVEVKPAAPELVHVPGEIKEKVAEQAPEDRERMSEEVKQEFNARRAYELSKPSISAKMLPTLDTEEKRLASPAAASILLACDVSATFINQEISTGNRFNIYAIQKVSDLVTALSGGFIQNAINRAIITSLFNFRDAGVPFTATAAMGAVSDKLRVDAAINKHLVRHTVSPATAPTQKSSTMSALRVLGIVENVGTRANEEWRLTDTPQVRRLEEIVRAAA